MCKALSIGHGGNPEYSHQSGNQAKTLQAANPLRSSSTHTSSKVIQAGRSPGASLLGLTPSQKPGALSCL